MIDLKNEIENCQQSIKYNEKEKDYEKLRKLAKEVSNWLKENGHPHMKVIIDQAGILLTEDIYGDPNVFLDNDSKECDKND